MRILEVATVVLVFGLVGAQDAEIHTPDLKSSTLPPSTTKEAPVTQSTTIASTTVPTPTPSSTTASTTPVPPTQSTSTVSPITVPTSPVPSTTPKPKPQPKEFYWNVTDSDGTVCILGKADIKLSLTYTNVSSKQEVKVDIPVPQNASSSGQCGASSQILQLSFGAADSITFNFTEKAGDYHLSEILSKITVDNGNGTTTLSLVSEQLKLYDTHLNTSYVCSWSEPATLQEDDAQRNITKANMKVTLKAMRFEAFKNSTEATFSKEYSCPMDSPDIVPVMVGIALGILVAVVLVAYLVGRRSTPAQGYLSM